MSYPAEDIGKKIKSGQPVKMYHRFPGSEDVQTLPPGKPSPKITGYTPKEYYVVKGNQQGDYYIRNEDHLQIVDRSSPDESGWLDSITTNITDFVGNTAKDIERNTGYVQEGWTKTIDDLSTDLWGGIKTVLIVIAVLAGLFFLIKLNEVFG